ncbi:metal-dependent hydrolase [Rhodoferax sp.]|uniref:metal-dependent hydrolase n=1 Tax=Rhodoferax sp. TaxID=50421 RepID=UPI00274F44FD|nr:metal-dependent hydrolase [Rhodoferax sp.]
MPITPLHFGLIPVINRVLPTKISITAFVIANILADIPILFHLLEMKQHEMGGPMPVDAMHSTFSHTLAGALVIGAVLGLFGFRSRAWRMGAMLGTLTHVVLDMFVHSDVQPFMPWLAGNPFYSDIAGGVLSVYAC